MSTYHPPDLSIMGGKRPKEREVKRWVIRQQLSCLSSSRRKCFRRWWIPLLFTSLRSASASRHYSFHSSLETQIFIDRSFHMTIMILKLSHSRDLLVGTESAKMVLTFNTLISRTSLCIITLLHLRLQTAFLLRSSIMQYTKRF